MDPVPPVLRKPARGLRGSPSGEAARSAPTSGARAPPPECDPAMTFTAVNARSTFEEPQAGQARPCPSAYADMDRRTSKEAPQSWQTKSGASSALLARLHEPH
jgi:hypothetical protein